MQYNASAILKYIYNWRHTLLQITLNKTIKRLIIEFDGNKTKNYNLVLHSLICYVTLEQ